MFVFLLFATHARKSLHYTSKNSVAIIKLARQTNQLLHYFLLHFAFELPKENNCAPKKKSNFFAAEHLRRIVRNTRIYNWGAQWVLYTHICFDTYSWQAMTRATTSIIAKPVVVAFAFEHL